MRILVIGGTGFIGTPLVEWLLTKGHHLAVLSRNEAKIATAPGLEWIQGNREKLADLKAKLDTFAADVVIDMIAMNESSTRPVLDVLVGRTGRYVLVSSCDVYLAYGRLQRSEHVPVIPVPMSESAPLRTNLYPYAKDSEKGPEAYDKIPIETMVRAMTEFETTIVRLPMVYGPNDPQHRFLDSIKRMVNERPVILLEETYANWRSSFGYVENVAAAIGVAATSERAKGQTFNVMDTQVLDMKGWVGAIGECLEWPGQIVTAPIDDLPEHLVATSRFLDFGQDLVVDAGKIRSIPKFKEPVSFNEGIQRTILYERNSWDQSGLEDFEIESEDAAIRLLRQTSHI